MRLKLLCLTLCAAFLVGVIPQITSTEAQAASDITLYVSQTGQDTGDGTLEDPLKTLNAARERIRLLRDEGIEGTATVYLRGGEYYLDRSFILNELDYNINFAAYNGEQVSIKGSTVLDNSLFRKVTDNEVLSHFPDDKVAEKILQYNLNSNGITQKPMNYRGSYHPSWIVKTTNPQELVINDSVQTVARYPNSGYAPVLNVSDWGVKGDTADTSTGFTFKGNDTRIRHWDKASSAMIYGHFVNGWQDRTVTISSVNPFNNTITTNEPYTSDTSENSSGTNGRYYVFNLLEELDTSGEYYIDSDKGILYLYPSETFETDKIELATLQQPLLRITNTQNITFSGIDFLNGNNYGIRISNCDNVCIKDGAVKNMARIAVDIQNSYNCGVDGLTIENVHGGVYIEDCGDLETLTPGNCYCKNTRIKNYANVAYTSGIRLSGVGNIASHNEISDSDHLAITFSGNEHVIEYNDIHDVLRCTTDAGAIYAGKSWTSRGNEIKYNYIHNITNVMSNVGSKCVAIYFDDGFCSADTYGNIIDGFPGIGIFVHGGKDFKIYNNIINSTATAIYVKQRYSDSTDYTTLEAYTSLLSSPYQTELWQKEYPELYAILDSNVLLPTGNSIYNNLSIKSDFGLDAVVNGTTAPNLVSTTVELDESFQLAEDSEVFTTLSGFENIDFENIGINKEVN